MKQFIFILCFICAMSSWAQTSDNGDGTFTNPVLWTDLPDPDVTQVGDSFYFVSTSMHMLPGATILKSSDLVNWTIATNVVPQFDNDPYFDMQGGNRYGKGQWATALRFWGGEFHVLFTSNSNGTFIYSSPTIEGKWRKTTVYEGPYHPILDRMKPLREQDRSDGFYHHILYDPGFLVDNDGRVYVVHGNSINYITELDPVSLQPLGKARLLYKAHREGLEGNKLYHIGEYYYVICTYGGNLSGNVICLRSHSLEGPWEEREVMCVGGRRPDSHILQASLIQLESGQTWAMAFLDMGVLGRIPHLVPVNWIDGWPVFGGWESGNLTLKKPLVKKDQITMNPQPQQQTFATSDDFFSTVLGLQWQFNHNPDHSKYSLSERSGFLRLYAQSAGQSLPKRREKNHLINNGQVVSNTSVEVSPDSPFLMARNTLTQRLFGPRSQAVAKIDASHLEVGGHAGLAILNIPYATVTILRTDKGFVLQQTKGDNKSEIVNESIELALTQVDNLWLSADVEAQSGMANFSYSFDGKSYKMLGRPFEMEYSGSYFVGNRFALFCYNNKKEGGYVDIDDFQVKISSLFNRTITPGSVLQAEWTDALWYTECRWSKATGTAPANMDVAWLHDGGMIAFNRLQYSDKINELSFMLRNMDAHHTFLELIDGETHETLGKANIPEPTNSFVDVKMALNKPLVSGHRLELRIWNQDWNQERMGEVLLDRITFN